MRGDGLEGVNGEDHAGKCEWYRSKSYKKRV